MTRPPSAKRTMRIARSQGLVLRVVDDHGFLLDAAECHIHHLNPTALAVWRILREPQTMRDIASVLKLAFPDVPAAEIERDVKMLVRGLLNENLAERARA
jgi:hypothetical protein